MEIVIFRGSLSEFAAVKNDLFAGGGRIVVSSSPVVPEPEQNAADGLSEQLIVRVLTRRALSPHLRKVLKALLKAGPDGLTTREIAEAVGISRARLAGVFGAFGRRMAHTPGWPEDQSIVNYEREYNDDTSKQEWRYWLKSIVRDVLERGTVRL
jgi:hypothetical protein